MKGALGFVAGIVMGQWLAFGATPLPVDLHARATRALERVEPAAAAGLDGGAWDGDEVAVPLESALGVWVVEASLNEGTPARFLVDTGSSVVIVAPAVAAAAGVIATAKSPRIELQTVAGRSSGPAVRIRSLRVGDLELPDVPAVLHDPGPGFDGILGNAFLSRYRLTLDPDRHLLVLRPLAPGPAPMPAGWRLGWGPGHGRDTPAARGAPGTPARSPTRPGASADIPAAALSRPHPASGRSRIPATRRLP